MTVKNSLTYSRRTGIGTAIGLGFGESVHIIVCLVGLAAIISQSLLFFNVLKIGGALYLIYIGIGAFRSRSSHVEIQTTLRTPHDMTTFQALRSGFLTGISNPKPLLFFLGLFTVGIPPETPYGVVALLAAIMLLNVMIWFSLVAVFFTQTHVRSVFERFQGIFSKIFGGLLVALGVKIALT